MAKKNDVIELNFDEILTLIQGQLLEYMNSEENYNRYKDFEIILSKEQQFMKLKDKNPKAIYIVVRFGSADVVFGQTVLPVTIMALTEENKIDSAYSLFYEYAQAYNLKRVANNTINQVYESPSISENFIAVYEGVRSIVMMSAAFVIGKNANDFKVYYYYNDNGTEYAAEIPQMATSFGFVGNPDTQAFYNSNDFTRSVIGFGAVSLSFTTFVLTDNRLVNDILSVLGEVDEEKGYIYVTDTTDEKIILKNNDDITSNVLKLKAKNASVEDIVKVGSIYFQYDEDSIWTQVEIANKNAFNNIEVIDVENISVITPNANTNTGTLWKYDGEKWIVEDEVEKIPCGSKYIDGLDVNKTFKLGIVYRDGTHARIKDYKLTEAVCAQEVGQIPSFQVGFSE